LRLCAKTLSLIVLLLFGGTVFARSNADDPSVSTSQSQLSIGEHFAEVNGVKLWYTLIGRGPLLVVQAPGWGVGSEYLRNGLTPLQSHFTLLYYDTRGSGRSSRPVDEKRMSTSDMVKDLEGLRQLLGLDAMTLLGHSHGGTIAIGYAISHPKQVRSLILIDSDIEDYPDAARTADFKREIAKRANDPRFKAAIKVASVSPDWEPQTDEEFEAHLKGILPLYFFDPVQNGPKFALTDTGPAASAWVSRTFDAASKTPMKQDSLLDRIDARTLIIVGRADWICPVTVATRIHHGVRNSELLVVERAGHFPWIEEPQQFFPAVVQFAQQ
jgi:pimeloyl-ACP methyl ester carboxylesterase